MLVINVDTTGGSGTSAGWNINLAGNVGATGSYWSGGSHGSARAARRNRRHRTDGGDRSHRRARCAGNRLHGDLDQFTGDRQRQYHFTTQSGLAYTVGARARAASNAAPTNYMEGLVTSYSGTMLVINVDTTGAAAPSRTGTSTWRATWVPRELLERREPRERKGNGLHGRRGCKGRKAKPAPPD